MTPAIPQTRDLVLIGGGHTHALLLKNWAMRPLPGVRITLIDPASATAYSGMLPGFVAGHYQREDLDIDLVRLARHAGARFVHGAAYRLDLTIKTVVVAGRPPIQYDIASIDVGVHSQLADIEGVTDHAAAVKPLGKFASAWAAFLEAARPGPASIVVIGGGVAGTEIALAMAHRMPNALITIVDQASAPLQELATRERKTLLRALHARNVQIKTDHGVAQVSKAGVKLSNEAFLPADFVVSAAGAAPHSWLAETGLAHDKGFVCVDEFLNATSDPAVFAVGDCAQMSRTPRQKAGVFAVRQAPILLNNLRAALGDGQKQAYRPQSDYLKLVSTGPKSAVAIKFGLALRGKWVWRLKDRIDQKFMRGLRELPDMQMPEPPEPAAFEVKDLMTGQPPLCGGCGAKVDQQILSGVLEPLSTASPSMNLQDDAAILPLAGGFQTISTDHLRAFTEDPWMMSRIAAVHALGDVWSMGATPQVALASITLPPLSPRLQRATLAEIMTAAKQVFDDAGATIAGGHTSIGPELSIGFTVTGTRTLPPIGLIGAQVGDSLILTKAIGTGVILAAEMAKRARGDLVMAALDQMGRSQTVAAGILADQANAMTDVTGFGLAGHLLNILEASGVSAVLTWDRVPLLNGAADLSQAGIRSSLLSANRAAAIDRISGTTPPDLIFDPQTAGGLLAAIPAKEIETIRRAFEQAGEPFAEIGSVQAGPPQLVLR